MIKQYVVQTHSKSKRVKGFQYLWLNEKDELCEVSKISEASLFSKVEAKQVINRFLKASYSICQILPIYL